MTKRKNIFLGVLIIIVILGGLFVAYNYYFKVKSVFQTQEKEEKVDNTLFYVAQAEGVWPKFVEVRIDPLKVSVGQVQKMKVVLENDVDIKEVKAIIETDNQKLEIPLNLQEKRAVTKEDIENKKYIVKDSKLVILDKNSKNFGNIVEQLVKSANAAQILRFEYVGEWIVHDTHDKTYHTIFKAYDEKGRENSITMAWSDPCSPPLGGDYTVDDNVACEVSPTGPDDGNVIIQSGKTLTIGETTPVTFVWGLGKSIVLREGAKISIKDGSQLKQSRIYVGPDADNDGYMPIGANFTRSLTPFQGSLYGASSTRAATTSLLSGDCNDSINIVHPGQNNYFSTSSLGGGSWDYDCDGTTTAIYSVSPDPSPSGYEYLYGYAHDYQVCQIKNTASSDKNTLGCGIDVNSKMCRYGPGNPSYYDENKNFISSFLNSILRSIIKYAEAIITADVGFFTDSRCGDFVEQCVSQTFYLKCK